VRFIPKIKIKPMRKIQIILLILLSASSIYAQDIEKKKTVYSFVPQYLINRGIRIDVEKHIKNNHVIQFCPQFYLSERDEDDFFNNTNKYNYLIGGGMNVYHKIFASSDYKKYGLYLSYGISASYFNIEYTDDSDNLNISAKADIFKTGIDVLLGYQIFAYDIISIDIYTGLGTRLSFLDTNGTDKDKFNNGYYGYAYTGNIMHLGLRIGVIL
jgi:hypothetical protein